MSIGAAALQFLCESGTAPANLAAFLLLQALFHIVFACYLHIPLWGRGVLAAASALFAIALRLSLTVRTMAKEGSVLLSAARARCAGADLEDLIEHARNAEAALGDVKLGQERGVVWFNPKEKQQTKVAIVFVHGWSASRRECSPLCENLGQRFGANCYFARLPGHGRRTMTEVGGDALTVRGMTQEVVNALAIGEKLGENVLLVGCSTGGALCEWICLQPWAISSLAGCVVISANNRTRPTALVKHLRCIPLVRELVLFAIRGVTTRNTPKNEQHGEAWQLTYPTHFLPVIFDISAALALEDPVNFKVPLLAFHHPEDPVADFNEAAAFVSRVPQGRMIRITDTGEMNHKHCIVGDIMSPSTMPGVTKEICDWLDGPLFKGKLA